MQMMADMVGGPKEEEEEKAALSDDEEEVTAQDLKEYSKKLEDGLLNSEH